MQSTEEIWEDITGCEGRYQISNFGKVKSLKRLVSIGAYFRPIPEKILKLKISTYLFVSFIKTRKRAKFFLVHRLVAEAFIPKPLGEKLTVNHKDGNKHNNHIDNLEWCTQLENNVHAIKNGKKLPKGDQHYRRTKKYNRLTKEWL